jgi:hypothetical protein
MTHRSKNIQPSLFEAGPPRVELRPKQKAELAANRGGSAARDRGESGKGGKPGERQ